MRAPFDALLGDSARNSQFPFFPYAMDILYTEMCSGFNSQLSGFRPHGGEAQSPSALMIRIHFFVKNRTVQMMPFAPNSSFRKK